MPSVSATIEAARIAEGLDMNKHVAAGKSKRPVDLPLAAIFFLGFVPAVATAEGYAIFGDVTASTDYVFRGVSQTMSGPALQGSLGVAHDSGLSAWVWGSNIDYVAEGDPDDGARVEINAVMAYEHAFGERLVATVGRSEYLFPGVNPGLDYDYGEWWGELALDDRHYLSAYHSDSVFNTGEPGWYAVAGTGIDLPAGLALAIGVGRADLSRALGESYNHVELVLSGSFDALSWQLALHATDGNAKEMFYESVVEPRAALTVTYTIW